MTDTMRCPHCDHPLYVIAPFTKDFGNIVGRAVQCDFCGLRGPVSERTDYNADSPLSLFAKHCTHSAETDFLRQENDQLREQVAWLWQRTRVLTPEEMEDLGRRGWPTGVVK